MIQSRTGQLGHSHDENRLLLTRAAKAPGNPAGQSQHGGGADHGGQDERQPAAATALTGPAQRQTGRQTWQRSRARGGTAAGQGRGAAQ